MKRQGIYWLCPQPTERYRAKANLLQDLAYDVTFFESLEDLVQGIAVQRVSIVLITDDGPENEVIRWINELASLPEIQGARLILVGQELRPSAMHHAAGQGFRDIMHLGWEDHNWLERFEFSTAGHESDISQAEQKVTVEQSLQFFLPARVVWINDEQVWLESRARPNLNESLVLKGPLAEALDNASLTITVREQVKSNLVFRFSEALIGTWTAQKSRQDAKVQQALDTIRSLEQRERPKVFVAMQSPALRNTILKYLSPDQYEVHTALQKRSLTMEPKFFSPHLVFIEDRLCAGGSMARFQNMVKNLPETSTVVVVGGREDLSSYRNFSAGRRLEALSRIPKNLPDLIQRNYLPSTHFNLKSDSFHLPTDHPYSFAEIELPGTAVQMSSQEVEIALPIAIEKYGLVRIASPTFEQFTSNEIYLKIISLQPDSKYGFIATGKFCTLDGQDQGKLAKALSQPRSLGPRTATRRKRSNI